MSDWLPDNDIKSDQGGTTISSPDNIENQHAVHPTVYSAEEYKVKAVNLIKLLRKETKLKEGSEAEKKVSHSEKKRAQRRQPTTTLTESYLPWHRNGT